MLTVSEAAALLRSFDRVLILTHIRPDGDTVGCAAGLCAALRAIGKTAYLLPNPGLTENTAPYFTPYSAPADFVPEKVVSTDIATVGLFPDNAKSYADKVDLAIDHHPSFEGFGKANIVRPEAAACGELILDIVRELTPLTPEIALPLYVAISTDTGGFIYSNVTAATHRAAAELMDTGIDYRAVNKLFFQTKSRVRMQLEAAMLAEAKFYDNNRTGGAVRPPVAAGKIPRHGERCGGPLRFRPPDPGGGLRCDHAGAGRRRLEVLSPYWRAGQRYGGLPSVGWRRPCPRRRSHAGGRYPGGGRRKNAERHRPDRPGFQEMRNRLWPAAL